MQKIANFKPKGMQRDLAASAFNPEYAYENKNIRITASEDNTLLSITNEKGNKVVYINGIGVSLIGTPIGQATIDDELVVFTTPDESLLSANISAEEQEIIDITAEEISLDIESEVEDKIYKLWFKDKDLCGKKLFSGNLGFNYRYPIETLEFYENQDLKKIYWTDGINQPRVINTAAAETTINNWTNRSFDFVVSLNLQEEVTVNKITTSSGMFAPGVVQYAFTYVNRYGQESNIFYTTPLYYISYSNRGGNPTDKVNNSFEITIKNIDTEFDYVRIYSIQRTSINGVASVRQIVDLSADENNKIYYIDNGTEGSSVDPTELLYIGGEEVIFGTMTQKDNTLFLGNIEIKRQEISDLVKSKLRGKKPTFIADETKVLPAPIPKGYYPYKNQLNGNSNQIKTFKYLEWYRFGIQAQHYTGKWSNPIFLGDKQNTVPISTTFYNNSDIELVYAKYTLEDKEVINDLLANGYVKIRPVIVYPTINDRECICQGILCPTVYNVNDRYSNTPFVQSSWFSRPNIPYAEDKVDDWKPLGTTTEASVEYSRQGVKYIGKQTLDGNLIDTVNKGAWAEFRHNTPIPGNQSRRAEIQNIWVPANNPYITKADTVVSNWVSEHANNYFVDQSILTLHSPDIEFNTDIQNLDTTNLKLRIVGVVPMTAFASDIDIQTSTPVNNYKGSTELPIGFYKENIGVQNDFNSYLYKTTEMGVSMWGYRSLMSGVYWFDEITNLKGVRTEGNKPFGFVVYPWHRDGSLNNTKYAKDGYKSALLSHKKLSNLKYSYKTQYLPSKNIWKAFDASSTDKLGIYTGISGVSIFNSNEISLTKIPAPKNSNLSDLSYYGNVDKLLTYPTITSEGYPIEIVTSYEVSEDALVDKNYNYNHDIFTGEYGNLNSLLSDDYTSNDPVRIKYKSTPHAIVALNYTTTGSQRILPTILDGDSTSIINQDTGIETETWKTWIINDGNVSLDTTKAPYWDVNSNLEVSQDVIDLYALGIRGNVSNVRSLEYGWLWLGELYNDSITNRFGGTTNEALENNLWLPCGQPVALSKDGLALDSVDIKWTGGDTYYQRYDNIKTYPFTTEDQNSVTEIVSFMCETRVNLDGRYDRNRGLVSNLAITPENFNQVNDVYSQQDNYFNYRTTNPDKINLDNYKNTITWTKTKIAGELTDTWTNITLASTLDLDGDKGVIRSLNRLNDNIIAFQDRGISQILYNENMQISSAEGVPIEIGNSGKVNGKRYITDNIGCTNKWSICNSPNGIYFVDNTTKGIYLFNGQVNNISDKLGFHSWMEKTSNTLEPWNPIDFNNFVTYYDKLNDDVLFITIDECLALSETSGGFTSFYSYEGTPWYANMGDRGVALHPMYNGNQYMAWLHNEGEYNIYFNKYQPFYSTVIVNTDMQADKTFNTLEFRADTFDKEGNLLKGTFDTLEVWNEYQRGKSTLKNILGKPSNLKKKFRIWRANIPRNNNGRDRIRNPWIYLKLSMEEENTDKTILHDLMVYYNT